MNSVASEILKLKRNRLVLILVTCVVLSPLLTPLLIGIRNNGLHDLGWSMYALQSQLPIYLCTLAFTIITASIMFAGEFQMRTINALFSSTGSRISICGAKLVAMLIILGVTIIPTGLVNLIVGAVATDYGISGPELLKYAQALLWSVPSYFALVPTAVLLSVLLKKPALVSIIYFAAVIMVFPFYEQALFIPPLLPMHLAMRLLSKGIDVSSAPFLNTSLQFGGTAVSLACYFGVPLLSGLYYVRRMDVQA